MVTGEGREGNAFDSSQDGADILALISPAKSTAPTIQTNAPPAPAPGVDSSTRGADRSSQGVHYRHPIHWRVAIVNKSGGKNDIYHGRTSDVSLSFIRVFLERNVIFTSEVVVLLAIPPVNEWSRETIVEVDCLVTHTVLESEHSQFRLGMKLIRFKGNGKKILSEALSKRPIPKPTTNQYDT